MPLHLRNQRPYQSAADLKPLQIFPQRDYYGFADQLCDISNGANGDHFHE